MTQILNNFASTFYFKEIFSDFDTFKQFVHEYTNVNKDLPENATLYRYLFNKFCNSNINYDTINSFKRNFALTYENCFMQYKFRIDKITKLYALADDDLTVIQYGISNVALNDNSVIQNALDNVADFVSSQTSSKQRANKFSAYLTAVRDISDNYIEDYIDKFRKHFMSIVTPNLPVYDNN